MFLSPIRFLIEDVKDIFKINSQEFFDAIQNIVSLKNERVKIKIVSKPLIGIREIGARWHVDTYRIEINECLLCAIWCTSYFVANAYVSLCEYLNEHSKELLIETDSLQLIKYAKSLILSYEEWPYDLPIPQDFDKNPYANLANMIMPIATDIIMCHELAHMFLKHSIAGGVQQEIEADNLAVSWILDQETENYPKKELGALSAFITLILIDANADKDGKRHPSSFERMNNYLENLKIEENDILWLLAILSYRAWEKSFEIITQSISFGKDSFKNIFKSLIIS